MQVCNLPKTLMVLVQICIHSTFLLSYCVGVYQRGTKYFSVQLHQEITKPRATSTPSLVIRYLMSNNHYFLIHVKIVVGRTQSALCRCTQPLYCPTQPNLKGQARSCPLNNLQSAREFHKTSKMVSCLGRSV